MLTLVKKINICLKRISLFNIHLKRVFSRQIETSETLQMTCFIKPNPKEVSYYYMTVCNGLNHQYGFKVATLVALD